MLRKFPCIRTLFQQARVNFKATGTTGTIHNVRSREEGKGPTCGYRWGPTGVRP